MKKSELRKIYQRRQVSLSESERIERSVRIKDRFFDEISLRGVRVLHFFHSIESKKEVETSFIVEDLGLENWLIKTVAPRVNFKQAVLEHLEVNRDTKLRRNQWGISEPVGSELVDEKEIDVVLVPLLCFDERGYRVGYGKGYYDKFLSACREDVRKIGLSVFEPIGEIEDVQTFDIALDYCITPERVWEF